MGFSKARLSYRSKVGRLERVRRGVYRLSTVPPYDLGDIIADYLDVERTDPTVSHLTALELFGLLEWHPSKVHISVLRKFRNLNRPAITLHTLSRPIPTADRTSRYGVRVTTPTRSILDSLVAGTQVDELRSALLEAHKQGLIGSDFGRRSLGLAQGNLVQQVWDALPARLLNETISYFIGAIARSWRVGAILLDPPPESEQTHETWRLVLEVGPDVMPYIRDEYRDYFSYEVEWPLTNPPFFEVEVVDRDEWSGGELATARRLA
jgi:predicted transcriptional regulator of viral defense system